MLPNISTSSVMQDTPTCCQKLLINQPTCDNCYIITNYNRPWLYTPIHSASIACSYLIVNHNQSWLITKTDVWSFQWPYHELIWWTKWHKYFFIMAVINKHQNDQWLQRHSIPFRMVIAYWFKYRGRSYLLSDSLLWLLK